MIDLTKIRQVATAPKVQNAQHKIFQKVIYNIGVKTPKQISDILEEEIMQLRNEGKCLDIFKSGMAADRSTLFYLYYDTSKKINATR